MIRFYPGGKRPHGYSFCSDTNCRYAKRDELGRFTSAPHAHIAPVFRFDEIEANSLGHIRQPRTRLDGLRNLRRHVSSYRSGADAAAWYAVVDRLIAAERAKEAA